MYDQAFQAIQKVYQPKTQEILFLLHKRFIRIGSIKAVKVLLSSSKLKQWQWQWQKQCKAHLLMEMKRETQDPHIGLKEEKYKF